MNGTFRNWVIFGNWALWPRFWPPLGWGASPTGVFLDQYFSCIHILLKQSFFSEFQVIPAAYIVNQVKFSCLFEPTWHIFFHFLPWMHWVERKLNFSLVFVQSFSIHVLISVRWVLNNATYVLQWQWTSCVRVTCKAWRNAHWPIASSVAILRGWTLDLGQDYFKFPSCRHVTFGGSPDILNWFKGNTQCLHFISPRCHFVWVASNFKSLSCFLHSDDSHICQSFLVGRSEDIRHFCPYFMQ